MRTSWPLRRRSQPVVSVDTKKKELVGNFKNGGSDYRPKGDPLRVAVHDFEDKDLGKVVPYGVYDVTANTGFVSVGITSDTAQFAVQSIRTWLARMGRERYPDMKELTITADCGGSNGARVRLWKIELQKLADETNLTLSVRHYPPGTSKWNRIEHRLFCHITQNWRGRPLTDRIAVVELIGATTTKAGLKVECALDERTYEKGIKVRNAEMDALDIAGDAFHPEWNYPIKNPARACGIVAVIVRDVLRISMLASNVRGGPACAAVSIRQANRQEERRSHAQDLPAPRIQAGAFRHSSTNRLDRPTAPNGFIRTRFVFRPPPRSVEPGCERGKLRPAA